MAENPVNHTDIRRVLLWTPGTLLSFSVMAISIRGLAGVLSVFEMLSIRSGFGLLFLIGLVAVRPQLRLLIVPRQMHLHALRNTVLFAAPGGVGEKHYIASACDGIRARVHDSRVGGATGLPCPARAIDHKPAGEPSCSGSAEFW